MSDVETLDKMMSNLLKQDAQLDRNIYLLTSEADIQYPGEIVPYLDEFKKYANFNLLKTHSIFVREHSQVTSHHVALLLGIYYSLASNGIPRFVNQSVNFFGKSLDSDKNPSADPIVDLRSCNIIKGKLFVEGVGILRGLPASEYQYIDYALILKPISSISAKKIELKLAKSNRPGLTKEFFDGEHFVIYDKCWFTTYQFTGVDINQVPNGEYDLYLKIKQANIEKILPLNSKKGISAQDNYMKLVCKRGGAPNECAKFKHSKIIKF
ncbi:hypothetical protein [Gallibacterium sp. AGMB14963]|uniref:hypothetical protein n=1 Tax=Gallibacterium faecale TaxID=3019086 RepID=UPI0022F17E90|nr:hypothetical protein [Gallibacterium sp. AGMB14963]MDA3978225.1 hypothetical protein [Gallibacterium sp. AGMB14963]